MAIKINSTDIADVYIGATSSTKTDIDRIVIGNADGTGTVLWERRSYLTFTANTAGSTVTFNLASESSATIETSTDGTTWSSYTSGTAITLSNVGDYVKFRNLTDEPISTASIERSYSQFVMTGSIAASGDCMSLLNFSDTMGSYGFYNLFYGCTSLTTAPELPATTLASHCYDSMFSGCTSLTTAPELPAMTVASSCYASMFYGCTALTTAPTLLATKVALYCYASMFYGCTSLTTAPTLPATNLSRGCYFDMFYGCSLLKVSEDGGVGSVILNIPSGTSESPNWNTDMFTGTGGTFTGSPQVGKTYYNYL